MDGVKVALGSRGGYCLKDTRECRALAPGAYVDD